MRILAVDTASGSGSVAVADGDAGLAEIVSIRRETHSRYLMCIIDQALRMAGIGIKDVDGFAVTAGPGSFTGLRIGISTVKGLAWATQKPVVGISSLEALALQAAPTPYLICSMLDARNQEVYCGRYRYVAGKLECLMADRPASPAAAIAGIEETAIFIGDGALRYREMITDCLGDSALFVLPFQHTLRAASILHLSRPVFLENRLSSVAGLVPRYLRKSVAETAPAHRGMPISPSVP